MGFVILRFLVYWFADNRQTSSIQLMTSTVETPTVIVSKPGIFTSSAASSTFISAKYVPNSFLTSVKLCCEISLGSHLMFDDCNSVTQPDKTAQPANSLTTGGSRQGQYYSTETNIKEEKERSQQQLHHPFNAPQRLQTQALNDDLVKKSDTNCKTASKVTEESEMSTTSMSNNEVCNSFGSL